MDIYLEDLIERYTPALHRRHCSNCLRAKVCGPEVDPQAYCILDPRHRVPLGRLLRQRNPRGFRNADRCPHFVLADEL